MGYDEDYAYWLSAFHMSRVAREKLTREEQKGLLQRIMPTSRWGKEYLWWVEVSNERAERCRYYRRSHD